MNTLESEEDVHLCDECLIDDLFEENDRLLLQVKAQSQKLRNQRQQLRDFHEKLALMKTFRGVLRTIGQRLGISR